eukprot:4891114-Alexandrium_andersonii.AAC.1
MMEWPSHRDGDGGDAPRPAADGTQPSGRPSRTRSCRRKSRAARVGGRLAGRSTRPRAGPPAGGSVEQVPSGDIFDALAGPH